MCIRSAECSVRSAARSLRSLFDDSRLRSQRRERRCGRLPKQVQLRRHRDGTGHRDCDRNSGGWQGLATRQRRLRKGQAGLETACAACHGADLKGVAGLPDMPSGAALRLVGGRGTLTSQKPIVTVESYWPYATTLFDYIRRAMP